MSNDDAIMIDSWDKIDLVIFYMYMYANDNSADQHALLCSPTIAIRDICLNAYIHFLFTFMLGFDAIRVGLFKILSFG